MYNAISIQRNIIFAQSCHCHLVSLELLHRNVGGFVWGGEGDFISWEDGMSGMLQIYQNS